MFTHAKDLSDSIAVSACLMWTSQLRLKLRDGRSMEFCVFFCSRHLLQPSRCRKLLRCRGAEQRGETPVIWKIKVDPRGASQLLYRCKHVNQLTGECHTSLSPWTPRRLHCYPHALQGPPLAPPPTRPHPLSVSPAGVQDQRARRVRVPVRSTVTPSWLTPQLPLHAAAPSSRLSLPRSYSP
jgi:hypothetical protein